MAEPTPPKPGAKPAAKGPFFKKKLGPLPVWAWLGIGAGAVLVLYLYSKRAGGGDEGYGGPETVSGSGSGGYAPEQAASSGAPSSNGDMTGQVSPDVLAGLQAQIGDWAGHVTELEDAFKSSGYSIQDDKTWLPPQNVTDTVADATLGPPGSQVVKNGSPSGVRWGGRTFTTKRGLAGYLASTGGGTKSASKAYQQWAQKHPGAAKQLSGPPPKKQQPKKAPARTTPKAQKAAPKAQPKKQQVKKTVPTRKPTGVRGRR